MNIKLRYAQHKVGQKLHLVPVVSGDSVSSTALCGKVVTRWGMTINAPLGHACQNCVRVNRLNGRVRTIKILKSIFNRL